jgi:multiple sugar transport system permease protein
MTDNNVKKEGSGFFGWAIWFWNVFCKQWVWETFCKNWVWQTFCKKWFWEEFCVKNVYGKFDKWKGWLYLSPAIVLLLIFTVWPIFNTVRMSLLEGYSTMLEANPLHPGFEFGFGNFTRVLKYQNFLICLKNTVILTVLTVPISTFIALLIAVCLNSIKFLNRFLQTVFFLPYVTNSIAIGMVFYAMFNMIIGGQARPDSVGIVNNVIEVFAGKGSYINWINYGSPYWANLFVMTVYIVWNALPFKILILLGGLQSVNKQYYEAAKVDGTSRSRTFWRITVPLLSPMIAYVVITGFIGGFKEYSSIVGIFGEKMGPKGNDYSMDTMVGFIYRALANQEGTASAAALILFGIIFAVTLVNLYVSKKKTHY